MCHWLFHRDHYLQINYKLIICLHPYFASTSHIQHDMIEFVLCVLGIIIITDGVTSVPDVAVCETLLNQLRSGTIACSFVQVSLFKCFKTCCLYI